MTMDQDGGKVVSLTHRPLLPPENTPGIIPVGGWVDPRAIVRSEGLCQWKIPMTPSGIEPATFRFLAQHLNHWALSKQCQYNLSKIDCKCWRGPEDFRLRIVQVVLLRILCAITINNLQKAGFISQFLWDKYHCSFTRHFFWDFGRMRSYWSVSAV